MVLEGKKEENNKNLSEDLAFPELLSDAWEGSHPSALMGYHKGALVGDEQPLKREMKKVLLMDSLVHYSTPTTIYKIDLYPFQTEGIIL